MKNLVRAGALVFAMTMGATLAVPLAMPAGAALKASGACASETSPPLSAGTAKSTFSGCTPVAMKLGGTGVSLKTPPPGTPKGAIALKITWKGGKGTTTVALKFAVAKTPGKCATGTVRITAAGTVGAETGAVAKIYKKGEPVTASTCVVEKGATAGKSSLEPGTKFVL